MFRLGIEPFRVFWLISGHFNRNHTLALSLKDSILKFFLFLFIRKPVKGTSYNSFILRPCLEMKKRFKDCLEKVLVSIL